LVSFLKGSELVLAQDVYGEDRKFDEQLGWDGLVPAF